MEKTDNIQTFERIRELFPVISKQKTFINHDIYIKEFWEQFCGTGEFGKSNPDSIKPPFDDSFCSAADGKADVNGDVYCSAEAAGTPPNNYEKASAGVIWNYKPDITKDIKAGVFVDYINFYLNGQAMGSETSPASGGGYVKAFIVVKVIDNDSNQSVSKYIGREGDAAMGIFSTSEKNSIEDRTIMVKLKKGHSYKIMAYLLVEAAAYADYNYYGSMDFGSASGKANVCFKGIKIIPENAPWIQTTIKHLPTKGYDTYNCFENLIKNKFNVKSYAPMQTKIEIAAGGDFDENDSFVNIYLDPAKSYMVSGLLGDDACELTDNTVNNSHIILQLPSLSHLGTTGTNWAININFDPELDLQKYFRKKINVSIPFILVDILSIKCNALSKLTENTKSGTSNPETKIFNIYDLSNWYIQPIPGSSVNKSKMEKVSLNNKDLSSKIYYSNLEALHFFDIQDFDNSIILATKPYTIVEFDKNLDHALSIIKSLLEALNNNLAIANKKQITNLQSKQVCLKLLQLIELNEGLIDRLKLQKPEHTTLLLEGIDIKLNKAELIRKLELLNTNLQNIKKIHDYFKDFGKTITFKNPETNEILSIYDIITEPLSNDLPDMNNMGTVMVLLKRIKTFIDKYWDDENKRFEIVTEDYFIKVNGLCKNGSFQASSMDSCKYQVVFDIYPRQQPLPLIKPPC